MARHFVDLGLHFGRRTVNTTLSSLLPFIEGGLLLLHILGFIAIFIILVYMAPHGSAKDVFTQFYNGGDWPTQGLSTMVGLIDLVFAFVGEKQFHSRKWTRSLTRS